MCGSQYPMARESPGDSAEHFPVTARRHERKMSVRHALRGTTSGAQVAIEELVHHDLAMRIHRFGGI